jgi:predicted SAM-dependent methyltransferase
VSPLILNVGCGTRTSPRCVNIDWSPYLRIQRSAVARALAPLFLRGERLEKLRALDATVVVHDLRKGIPAAAASADVVYHSHVLEHIERGAAPRFLAEVRRVLKPGGMHRIVVPDFEFLARRYLAHLERCASGEAEPAEHDGYVGSMIEMLVRGEAHGTSVQRPLRRWLENRLLGDARRRGEAHRWMYDRINLPVLLQAASFESVQVVDYKTSAVPGWDEVGLDRHDDGSEYMPGSLYLECTVKARARS